MAAMVVIAGLAGCKAAHERPAVHVAVASNFTGPARQLAAAFEDAHDVRVVVSSASTGKLLAQIRKGAPFDVYLAADAAHPAACVASGDCDPASVTSYAVGQLVLLAVDEGAPVGPDSLSGDFSRLAIANPGIAPYGQAAMQVLENLDLDAVVRDRIVQGDSVGQAFHFVSSGAADYGFVALSQARSLPPSRYWIVPGDLHAPVLQDAALTTHGAGNPLAADFMTYLQSEPARTLIHKAGYDLPAPPPPAD